MDDWLDRKLPMVVTNSCNMRVKIIQVGYKPDGVGDNVGPREI